MLKGVFAALAVLLLPSLAFAWGGEGHQLTALIARTRLTPEAKAGIHDLLGSANISDAEIASWADEIRRSAPATGPYHYVDADVGEASIDLKADGHKGKNVVDGIQRFTAILTDLSATKDDRNKALRWVVHLVGDAHQPLHCCDRNNDKGGNAVDVLFEDRKKPANLHSVWDGDLIRAYVGRGGITAYAQTLVNKMSDEDVKT